VLKQPFKPAVAAKNGFNNEKNTVFGAFYNEKWFFMGRFTKKQPFKPAVAAKNGFNDESFFK